VEIVKFGCFNEVKPVFVIIDLQKWLDGTFEDFPEIKQNYILGVLF
jgi:hypothetical protein